MLARVTAAALRAGSSRAARRGGDASDLPPPQPRSL